MKSSKDFMRGFTLFLLLFSIQPNLSNAATKKKKAANKYDNQICGSSFPALVPPKSPSSRGRHYQILDLLVDKSISGPTSLGLSSSPQHAAMCWIIHTDPKKLNVGNGKQFLQRYALATVYFATLGPDKWTTKSGWLSGDHECTWHGVSCSGGVLSSKWVTGIDLAFNDLAGVIPREISLLKDTLETLSLYANEISGILPPKLAELKNLKVLKLHINALIGNIPPNIGQLKNLRELVLYGNYLNGKIPTDVGNLVNLEIFDVYANHLTGTVPSASMAKMKNLKEVYLNDNDLTGRITKTTANSKTKSLCDLRSKKLSVLAADCRKNPTAEVTCDCCTIACNDKADPKCVKVESSTSTKKK